MHQAYPAVRGNVIMSINIGYRGTRKLSIIDQVIRTVPPEAIATMLELTTRDRYVIRNTKQPRPLLTNTKNRYYVPS